MNIKSEENTYLFCQLLNGGSSDIGTSLFVKHLYLSGQLKYIKALFKKEMIIKDNKDLPYLIALENVLEKFALEFDGYLASISRNKLYRVQPDIESVSLNLIEQIKVFQKDISIPSLSLVKKYSITAKFVNVATEFVQRLKKVNSGIDTNVFSLLEFLENLDRLSLSRRINKYFYFLGGNQNG